MALRVRNTIECDSGSGQSVHLELPSVRLRVHERQALQDRLDKGVERETGALSQNLSTLCIHIVEALESPNAAADPGMALDALPDSRRWVLTRAIGSAVLLPFAMRRRQVPVGLVRLIADSVAALPGSPTEPPARRAEDYALVCLLEHLGVRGFAAAADPSDLPAGDSWLALSRSADDVAALAVPGLVTPAREALSRERLAIERGLALALLEFRYVPAARLVRWLAVLEGSVEERRTAIAALEHLDAVAPTEPWVSLHSAVARWALG